MADYQFSAIEKKWQNKWQQSKLYKATEDTQKPKYYVLDMFPYPSGAGLHVGHPLGYIASDIMARYKRLKGFNVLHPIGFDSFGLPAEQYAIQTGQHPALTTEENITRYISQLQNIGFSFDWDREVRTSAPDYYKWTQWIFKQLFNAYYDQKANKAQNISVLIAEFEKNGNINISKTESAVCDEDTPVFSQKEWQNFSEKEKSDVLLKYRMTFLADAFVNWCPALGTVLANDEIKDGVSERGGYPVERKRMRQWMMRITAYAERLLNDLDGLDWSDSIKEIQRNWIGKSIGAEITFYTITTPNPSFKGGEQETTPNPSLQGEGQETTPNPSLQGGGFKTPILPKEGLGVVKIPLTVFTTRVDTIFGVTYLAIAPEHELVPSLTTNEQKNAVAEYVEKATNRSERDRMADVKTVSGVFTGSFVTNPFNNEQVPVWIADYVLAGYGTGVVMAVPCSDDRDYRFAKHFNLPIVSVIEGTETLENPTEKKYGKMINSGFLNGLDTKEAINKGIEFAVLGGFGKKKVNYKMREAVFSRQRYWGEPVPVYFKNDIPHLLEDKDLPLELPKIDKYLPTETGEPPLGRAENWNFKENNNQYEYELSTMPGWAGSSWYWLRYMDANNENAFVSKEKEQYWKNVDLYIGGAEHATGHLLYSRFWNKFLFDMGFISSNEPFTKLINQGMIQGRSNFVYRLKNEPNKFVSFNKKDQYDTTEMHVDVNIVENEILDLVAFRAWSPDLANAEFILEDNGKYVCGVEIEKMSKRWYNVVNPDAMVSRYGADTLRLYEMFLGPLEQFKPWNTNGIDGTHKFLRKMWRLFHNEKFLDNNNNGDFFVSEIAPTPADLKALHSAIKRVSDDFDRFSFNTQVSNFMICANELTELKCNKRAILEQFVVLVSPYAPHIAEELWELLGHKTSISFAQFPSFNEEYLKESSVNYPISINGKVRANRVFDVATSKEDIEKAVLADVEVIKWLEGKAPKKVIVVVGKIVNLVV